MKNRFTSFSPLKKILFTIISVFILSGIVPTSVQAQTVNWQSEGSVCVYNGSDVATIQGFQCLIGNILMIFVTLIGIVGFVMMIFAAFRMMISGGDSKGMDSARKTMTYAVIGLVVALSAYFIVNIISQFTGIDTLLNFTIPDSTTQWTPDGPVYPTPSP